MPHTRPFQQRRIYKGQNACSLGLSFGYTEEENKACFRLQCQEWNTKMARKSKVHVSRINLSYQGGSWRRIYIYIYYPKKKQFTKLKKKSPFSDSINYHILLQPNILMEGLEIEDFMSLLVAKKTYMSFMATHVGPNIRKYGETYLDNQISTQKSNSPQGAVELLQSEKHSIFIPWFTGQIMGENWSMVLNLNRNSKVCFYHFDCLN
jgi:hypothetical protein